MATDGHKFTALGWAEALLIFAKYQRPPFNQGFNVAVEHDTIWAGLDDDSVITGEDRARLEALLWHHKEREGFYRYV